MTPDTTPRDGILHFHLLPLLLLTNFSFGARNRFESEKDTADEKFEILIQIANLGPRISIALHFPFCPCRPYT